MPNTELFKEIYKLPNYLYTFQGNDGKEHFAILGGNNCLKQDYNIPIINKCNQDVIEMQRIYEKQSLSYDDKLSLATKMNKIQQYCDYRKEGLYTMDEQKSYLSSLSKEELDQIKLQVHIYKIARQYFIELNHRKII